MKDDDSVEKPSRLSLGDEFDKLMAQKLWRRGRKKETSYINSALWCPHQ